MLSSESLSYSMLSVNVNALSYCTLITITVCDTRSPLPAGVDGGADQIPDIRDNLPNVVVEPVPTTREVTPTEELTTDIPTTEGQPLCESIMPELQCAQVDCFLIFSDVLTIDGVECLGCQR